MSEIGACDEDIVKAYRRAGELAARVRREAVAVVKEGSRLIDICEWVERRIRELGGQPAFPCNISVNDVAAHYTPLPYDESRVPSGAVVKIDIGVHVDGFIADTAVTVALDERYQDLVESVEEALAKVLEKVKPGISFTELGAVIEEAIKRYGYKPIVNLSGHSLARYTIHAGEIIPNTGSRHVKGHVRPCTAYAIEPFATNGEGIVVEREPVTIYAYNGKPLRQRLPPDEKKLLATIVSRYRTLPFTPRWLLDTMEWSKLSTVLAKLVKRGILISYPVLVERSGGIVAQAEHTVLVLEREVLVLTA
jgi:methionyl aminopeptidase